MLILAMIALILGITALFNFFFTFDVLYLGLFAILVWTFYSLVKADEAGRKDRRGF